MINLVLRERFYTMECEENSKTNKLKLVYCTLTQSAGRISWGYIRWSAPVSPWLLLLMASGIFLEQAGVLDGVTGVLLTFICLHCDIMDDCLLWDCMYIGGLFVSLVHCVILQFLRNLITPHQDSFCPPECWIPPEALNPIYLSDKHNIVWSIVIFLWSSIFLCTHRSQTFWSTLNKAKIRSMFQFRNKLTNFAI